MSTITIYSDGGARGNPGPSAIGYVVSTNEAVLYKVSKCIGYGTNNTAEYEAIKNALESLLINKVAPGMVVCYLDSQLVVNQLTGLYRIKEPHLQKLALEVHSKIRNLQENGFISIEFRHIPRNQNKVADALVNQALDERLI